MSLFALLCLMTLVLAACGDSGDENEGEDGASGRMRQLLTCAEGSQNCSTQWVFTFPASTYPKTSEIIINGNVVIDECTPASGRYYTRQQTVKSVEIVIPRFASIAATDTIDLRINDRGDCTNSYHEMKYYMVGKKIVLSSEAGISTVTVDVSAK